MIPKGVCNSVIETFNCTVIIIVGSSTLQNVRDVAIMLYDNIVLTL